MFQLLDCDWTYAGQCKNGHACGLGVAKRGARKVYAEHGDGGRSVISQYKNGPWSFVTMWSDILRSFSDIVFCDSSKC